MNNLKDYRSMNLSIIYTFTYELESTKCYFWLITVSGLQPEICLLESLSILGWVSSLIADLVKSKEINLTSRLTGSNQSRRRPELHWRMPTQVANCKRKSLALIICLSKHLILCLHSLHLLKTSRTSRIGSKGPPFQTVCCCFPGNFLVPGAQLNMRIAALTFEVDN